MDKRLFATIILIFAAFFLVNEIFLWIVHQRGTQKCISIHQDPWCCGQAKDPIHDWADNECQKVNGMWTGGCRYFDDLKESQKFACKEAGE